MSKKNWIGLITLAAALTVSFQVGALTGGSATQPPPRNFPYQGYLEDSSGPITGQREITFFITDESSTSISGTCRLTSPCRWSGTETVDVRDGYFSVELGGVGFPSGLFDRSELYLRLRVADVGGANATELAGGQRLLATPYAITAQVASTFHVNSLNVSGRSTFNNTVTTGTADDVRVGGGLRVGGDADVPTGDARISGELRATSVLATDVTISDDLFVTDDARVLGDLTVNGTLNGLFSQTLSATASHTTPELNLGSTSNRFCSLSEVRIFDNEGSGSSDYCRVEIRGSNYWLVRGGRTADDVYCRARCLRW